MPQDSDKLAARKISVRIESQGRRRQSVVIHSSGERVWLDGHEFEKLIIVEPAGWEREPLFHEIGRPYEAILSVAFQAISERR
ncbi:MAG: hypothetical protein PHI34_09355 [Acidobacteriota bacterium]|nr:hypothetical protein [Acidobacteriota bacterium]